MSVLQSLAFAVILIVYCSVGTVTVQSEAFGSAGTYREGEQFFQTLTHLRQRRQAGGNNSTVFRDPKNSTVFRDPKNSTVFRDPKNFTELFVTLINRQNESTPLPPTTTIASSTDAPNESYVENATETSTVALTHVEASCTGALVGVAIACLLFGCLVTLLVQILARMNGHANQGLQQHFRSVLCCGRDEDRDFNSQEVVAPSRAPVTFLVDHPPQKSEQEFRDTPHNEPFMNPAQPAPVYVTFDNHKDHQAPLSRLTSHSSHDDPQPNGYLPMKARLPTHQVPHSEGQENLYENVPLN